MTFWEIFQCLLYRDFQLCQSTLAENPCFLLLFFLFCGFGVELISNGLGKALLQHSHDLAGAAADGSGGGVLDIVWEVGGLCDKTAEGGEEGACEDSDNNDLEGFVFVDGTDSSACCADENEG